MAGFKWLLTCINLETPAAAPIAFSFNCRASLWAGTQHSPSYSASFTLIASCTCCQGFSASCLIELAQHALGCADEAVVFRLRISRSVASVGMPRSMIHMRRALPCNRSIFAGNSCAAWSCRQCCPPALHRQRQTVRCDNQCNDNLPAVASAIAAVAVLGRGNLLAQSLEVGAGKIVQQHIERTVQQRLPPLRHAGTAILVRKNPQLAARLDQPVDHQQLQHLGPRNIPPR